MFSIENCPQIIPSISEGMHMQNGLYSSAIALILRIGHRCAYLHRCWMFFLSKAKVCNEFLTVEAIEHGRRRVEGEAEIWLTQVF